MNELLRNGLRGFPDSEGCKCYPECRNDCPDYLKCVERLPEYAERVFGSDKNAWPDVVRANWDERGYKLLRERGGTA